jgi:hypothetical protein
MALWEWSAVNVIYRLGSDVLSRFLQSRHKPSPVQVLQLREKWKPIFESKIQERRKRELSRDAIIRDVRRIDSYPQVDERKKGISSWFRVGLAGTYDRGIRVVLSWEKLCRDESTGRWLFPCPASDGEGSVTLALTGLIRYENIASVDLDGDQYYSQPQVYCHFVEKKGWPYERLVFCEHIIEDRFDYFSERVSYDDVQRTDR